MPLRVAIVTDTFHPSVNGVVRSVDVAREGLERLGVEVHVFAPATAKARRSNRDAALRLAPAFETSIYPGLHLAVRPLLPRDIRGFDVVHVQTPGPLGASAALAARRAGAKLVYTYHTRFDEAIGHFAPRRLARLLARGNDRYQKALLERADVVIAPTASVAQEVEDHFGVHAVVHPTGLDPRFADAAEAIAKARSHTGRRKATRVLYLGRLAPEKNLEMLLRAFVLVREERPAARLVMAGSGPSTASLQRLARELRIEGSVEWSGAIDEADLARTYASADVFVTPSTYETQGLTILEAMAVGTPVACPALPVFESLAAMDAVTTFDARYASSIARGILDASTSDPERVAAARRGFVATTRAASPRRLLAIYRGVELPPERLPVPA